MIIIIILLQNCKKIHEITILDLVLITRNNQAERKLFIRTHIVFTIVVIELLLD